MKKQFVFILFIGLGLMGFNSCTSEFEKLRASGDAALIYKKAMEFYDKGEFLKAQTLYELVMPSYRGKPELEKMSYNYAYTHYNLKNYISANYYFKSFANTFTTSLLREEADYMAAFCNYKQSPSFRLDQDNTLKAIDGFQLFINTYPNSPKVKECNKTIDNLRKKLEVKAFDEGQLYYDLHNYQASIQVFENMLKDYPETADAEKIRFMILKGQYLMAENSIFEKQEERYRKAIEKYNDFTNKFPNSKYKNEATSFLKVSNNKIKELTNVRYQNKGSRS
jgi:outer membrane protein assembly factor BamD